jgi:hypothetical protein
MQQIVTDMSAVCAHCTAARESSERTMMRIEERQSWECYELNARNHVRLVSLVGAQYFRAVKLMQHCIGSAPYVDTICILVEFGIKVKIVTVAYKRMYERRKYVRSVDCRSCCT